MTPRHPGERWGLAVISSRLPPPVPWRLLIFASGDFAFNLYWQSATLYLLFYYTEALHLPAGLAAACYAIASIWDGIVSLAISILLDRIAPPAGYRRCLVAGSLPLGLGFVLAYAPPPGSGAIAVAWVVGGHMLFRTLYALANIPYLAMSARASTRRRERTLVAGGRMVAGTVAAMTVALGTLPLGTWLTGSAGAQAYLAAAIAFAIVASALLVGVGMAYRDAFPAEHARAAPTRGVVAATWRNPAFVWLAAAMVTIVVPMTVIDRSVLYYFKYDLHDQARGQLTLGAMMAVSGVATPLWLLLSRAIALRGVWLAAIATCLAALLAFVIGDPADPLGVQLFLIVLQAGSVGLGFAMWALMPEAIDHGRRRGQAPADATVYGWSALLQRIAIGFGTLLLGLGAEGTALSGAWLRLALTVVPLGFFALSGLVMLLNPYAARD